MRHTQLSIMIQVENRKQNVRPGIPGGQIQIVASTAVETMRATRAAVRVVKRILCELEWTGL